jgi:HSF-type DNA-binding
MNHFEAMASSASNVDKLSAPPSSQPISVRDAILTAAFGRDVHGMFSHFQQQQASPCRGFPSSSSLFEAKARATRMDLIRNIFSSNGSQMTSPSLLGGRAGLLTATRSPNLASDAMLLEAALEQRRRNFERIQLIRQQALALTKDSPFHKLEDGFPGFPLRDTLSHLLQQQPQGQLDLPQQHRPNLVPLNPEGTLTALGSAMRKKSSPYIDASSMVDPDPTDLALSRRTRGGVTEPFPEKLHRMLKAVADSGDSGIISFYAHGRAFGVHDPERFVKEVMPIYFKQSRLSSFQRQLNLYGFTRISSGPDTGGYYHELFLQARPTLCVHMRRVGVPQGSEDRRKLKSGAKRNEPDFYTMKSVAC